MNLYLLFNYVLSAKKQNYKRTLFSSFHSKPINKNSFLII